MPAGKGETMKELLIAIVFIGMFVLASYQFVIAPTMASVGFVF